VQHAAALAPAPERPPVDACVMISGQRFRMQSSIHWPLPPRQMQRHHHDESLRHLRGRLDLFRYGSPARCRARTTIRRYACFEWVLWLVGMADVLIALQRDAQMISRFMPLELPRGVRTMSFDGS